MTQRESSDREQLSWRVSSLAVTGASCRGRDASGSTSSSTVSRAEDHVTSVVDALGRLLFFAVSKGKSQRYVNANVAFRISYMDLFGT